MHGAPAAFVALFIAGCSPAGLAIVEPPPIDGRSAALLMVADGAVQRVVVWNADEPTPTIRATVEADEVELHLLSFSKPLSSYGYASGTLEPDPTGEPLPPATTRWARVVSDGSIGAWVAAEPVPSVESVRAIRTKPCVALRSSRIALPDSSDLVQLFAVLPDGDVLMQVRSGAYYRVSPDRAPIPLPSLGVELATGSYLDGRGQVWLAIQGGDVRRGSPETGFTSVGARTSTLPAVLAGPPLGSNAPFELYAFDERGRLEGFDGSAWTVLRNLNLAPSPHALVWVGPGELYMGGYSGHAFRWIDGTLDRVDDLLATGPGRLAVHTMFAAPGLGWGLGMIADDQITYHDERVQVPIPASGLPAGKLWGTSLADEAILIGGPNGSYTQWWRDRGYCPIQFLDDGRHPYGSLVPIVGGFITAQRLLDSGLEKHVLFLLR